MVISAMPPPTETDRSSFESRFAGWVVRFRWPILFASLIAVGIIGSGTRFLTLSTDYRIFFDQDNPQLLALQSLEDTYGKSDHLIFIVAPEDGDALSEQALTATSWITEQAWQTPYSVRVDSITNFPHTTADDETLVVSELIDPAMFGNAEKRSEVRTIALADPRVANKMLARDGSVTTVQTTLALPEEGQETSIPEVVAFAQKLVAEAENRFPGVDLRLVGTVMINHEFTKAAISSQQVFLPVSLAVMALILAVLTRSLAGVGATGLVMILSVVVSLGMGGWTGLPFSPPVAPAPTIVLMVVVANCVHILVTLQQRLQAGDPQSAAIMESIRVNLYPVFIASLTTAFGFLTMNFAEVPPHRHLGNYVAFGIAASFVLSVTFLPALLSLLPMRVPANLRNHAPIMAQVSRFVLRYQKTLLYGSVAIVAVLATAIPRNEMNEVLAHFFDESVEFRQDLDFLDRHLGGNTVLEYSLQSSGEVTEPGFLEEVSAFADWYRQQPEVQHVATVTDTFRQINRSMNGDAAEEYRLPESAELASQYLFLYEISLPRGLDIDHQVSFDKTSTRLTVTAKTLSSRDVLTLDQRSREWLSRNTEHVVSAQASGPTLLFAHISQRNTRSMLLGTAIVLLVISAMLIVAFRSIRLGLVSLVPNFAPAVIGFGIWGLTVEEVGSSLSVVVAMTIGIVVDDTVHFIGKYRRARHELGHSPEEAIRYSIQTVGRAIFTTTAVLVLGFLVLLFSPFVPTAQVGLLTALIIGFALVCDLLLLPPLLLGVERFLAPPRRPGSGRLPAHRT